MTRSQARPSRGAVHLQRHSVERSLQSRHNLRLHGRLIGSFTLGLMWLVSHVQMRLTYRPLPGALVCAVLLGACIDHFLPQAQSLTEAVRLLRAR